MPSLVRKFTQPLPVPLSHATSSTVPNACVPCCTWTWWTQPWCVFFREMIKHHTILQKTRVQDQDQQSKTKFYCSFTAGYTFPGKNPELWYRGKVNVDSQGRYCKATIIFHMLNLLHICFILVLGISSKPPIQEDTMAGPLFTTIIR